MQKICNRVLIIMRKEFEEKTEIFYPIKRYEGIKYDGEQGIPKNG